MPLSGELQALHDREEDYEGDFALVQPLIADKYAHMVIAAPEMGTSTSLDKAVRIFPNSARVNTLSTREGKMGDPLKYRTNLSVQVFKNLIIEEALVNFAIQPTGEIFGSKPEGYTAEHNFLHTMPSAVPQLKKANFKGTTETYLYMQPAAWEGVAAKSRFNGEKKAAIENSIASFKYGLAHIDTLNFVKNYIGRQDQTAREIAFVSIAGTSGFDKNKVAKDLEELLAIAEDLAVQSE